MCLPILKPLLRVLAVLMLCGGGYSAASSAETQDALALKHGNRFLGGKTSSPQDQAMGYVTRDIAQDLGRRLGASVRDINCPFKRCLSSLESGHIDIMLFLKVTPQRAEVTHFVQVWPSTTHVVFMVLADDVSEFRRYTDLEGRVLGVVKGYDYFPKFDVDDTLRKISFVTPQQLPKVLLAGRIDAFPTYQTMAVDIQRRFPSIKPARFKAHYGSLGFIAISKQSPLRHRAAEVDAAALAMIRDGTLDIIMKRYVPGERLPYPESLKSALP